MKQILPYLFLLLLFSCKTVKKASETHTASTDSVATEKVIISAQTDKADTHVATTTDTTKKQSTHDYETAIVIEKTYDSTGKIRSVVTRIQKKGNRRSVEVSGTSTRDSSSETAHSNFNEAAARETATHSDDSSKMTSVEKTKTSFPWWLLIALVCAGILYYAYRRYAKPFKAII